MTEAPIPAAFPTDEALLREEGSWTVLGLPRSHWHCQLSNFDFPTVRPTSTPKHVAKFLQSVLEGGSPHLFLTGGPGAGKSHLSAGIYRQAARFLGTGTTRWLSVPDFCDLVKSTYGSRDGWDPFEEYRAAVRLVVLDDLLGRSLQQHEVEQIVYRLVDIAYMAGAAVVVTMNPPVDELRKHFHPHEVSRLLAESTVLPIQAQQDWRRK